MCYPLSNLTSSGMSLKFGTVEYPPQASFEAKISFYSLHWPGRFELPTLGSPRCLNHRPTTTKHTVVPCSSVCGESITMVSALSFKFSSQAFTTESTLKDNFHLKFDFTAKCVNLNGVPWSYVEAVEGCYLSKWPALETRAYVHPKRVHSAGWFPGRSPGTHMAFRIEAQKRITFFSHQNLSPAYLKQCRKHSTYPLKELFNTP